MAKTTKKVVKTTTTNASELAKLTKEELIAHRKANVEKQKELTAKLWELVAERKKVIAENKSIRELFKKTAKTKTVEIPKVKAKSVAKKPAKKI
jgi:hypothetical protein